MVAPPSATTPEHRQVPVTGNPTKGGRSFAIAKRDPTGRLGTTLTVTVTDGHVVASASPIGSVLMVSPSLTWVMVRWTRTILSGNDRHHAIAPAGTQPGPPSGAPRPGGPPPPPAGKFPGPGPPGPGAARGPPGGPSGAPPGPPFWGPFRGPIYIISYYIWGVQGGTPLGAFLGPRAPGGPGGQKVHIFLGI